VAEINSSLRELAKSFAAGELETEQYRRDRSVLLTEITGDSKSPVAGTNAHLVTRQNRRGNLTPVTIVIALGVVLIIALGLFFYTPSASKKDAKNKLLKHDQNIKEESQAVKKVTFELPAASDKPGNQNEPEEPQKITPDLPASPEELVKAFLTKGDWSVEAVSQLSRRWKLVPQDEQEKAKEADWFSDFAKSLLFYLKTQKTRSKRYKLGLNYSYLENLAEYLGIRIPEEPKAILKNGLKAGKKVMRLKVKSKPVTITAEKMKKTVQKVHVIMAGKTKHAVVFIDAGQVKKRKNIAKKITPHGIIPFSWNSPSIKKLGKNRFMVVLSLVSGDNDVNLLLKDHSRLNLKLILLNHQSHSYIIQKEFAGIDAARQFSTNIIEIFRKIQK